MISRNSNPYLIERARVPVHGKIGVETLDERVIAYIWQQNGRFGRAQVPRRWGMYCETISYYPMRLQSALQLGNWVWYLYLQILSFSIIVTCYPPTRKLGACFLPQVMVHIWCREIGIDGSKTSGVFPVRLKRWSCLSLCSSLGSCFVKLFAGRKKRMRYESNLDCADAGSACKKMARRQSQG